VFTTLISTSELAARLHDASTVVVDCRFDLADPSKGRREYDEAHLPGARYVGLEPDLSGPKTGTTGRHPLPEIADFLRVLGTLGVTPASQLVAYDDKTGLWASRLWWMLRFVGHDAVAVLDGGLAKWKAEEREVTAALPAAAPVAPPPYAAREDMRVTIDDVVARTQGRAARLIDARAAERYRGDSETIDRVAGHIPGAANFFFQQSLQADGTFLPADVLRAKWTQALAGHAPSSTICYCGSGVTACHSLLSLEHAGLPGAKLYPGSWSEWSSDPSRPVATGTGA
jgi:thiosulfate/3-mercaptopyruvate sulfurtransferase